MLISFFSFTSHIFSPCSLLIGEEEGEHKKGIGLVMSVYKGRQLHILNDFCLLVVEL